MPYGEHRSILGETSSVYHKSHRLHPLQACGWIRPVSRPVWIVFFPLVPIMNRTFDLFLFTCLCINNRILGHNIRIQCVYLCSSPVHRFCNGWELFHEDPLGIIGDVHVFLLSSVSRSQLDVIDAQLMNRSCHVHLGGCTEGYKTK